MSDTKKRSPRQNTPAIKRALIKAKAEARAQVADQTALHWVHHFIDQIADDCNGIKITLEDEDKYREKLEKDAKKAASNGTL